MRCIVIVVCLLLSACANIPTLSARRTLADHLAAQNDWHAERLAAGKFDLLAYVPNQPVKTETLVVYIEGDGLAWISAEDVSDDPTPVNPLGLRLALAQKQSNVAYLARPCQFIGAGMAPCTRRYWTNMRFAAEVIDASSAAIDLLKRRYGADKILVVGYSGGGAVAALVAAKRHDVIGVVTVAGNLDHQAWTTYHRIAPLAGSLNAADAVNGLASIQQWHFVGGKDKNITPEITQSYIARFPENQRPKLYIEPDFDHRCCWVEKWPDLWRKMQVRE
jgi:pimeloyl-ACP methyl ester carboxylesterase